MHPGERARPEGIEPPTCGFEGRRSVHLSYGRMRRIAAHGAEKRWVSEGARTLNPRIHSPVLYRLSYTHRNISTAGAGGPGGRGGGTRPEGVEPPTRGLEGRCSIQLSYGRKEPGSRFRAAGPRGP